MDKSWLKMPARQFNNVRDIFAQKRLASADIEEINCANVLEDFFDLIETQILLTAGWIFQPFYTDIARFTF